MMSLVISKYLINKIIVLLLFLYEYRKTLVLLNSVRLWRKTLVLRQPIEHSHVIPESSNEKSREALCGTSLIDVAVQDAGVTPNLNVENISHVLRVGLDVDSSRLGFKIGCDSTDVIKSKRTNIISCKGKKGGESATKGSNVKEDSSPCMGKVKQGSWKKEGRETFRGDNEL